MVKTHRFYSFGFDLSSGCLFTGICRKRIRVPSVPFDALSKCCGHSGVHRSVRHLLQQHHERRVEAWYYKEFTVTVKNALIVAALTILYLFALQQGQNYSRLALFLMIPIYVVITYLTRLLLKSRLKKQMEEGTKTSLLIITSQDIAHRVVKSMKENNFARYVISGVALVDADRVGNVIEGSRSFPERMIFRSTSVTNGSTRH